jgi:hypothetical protein
MSQFYLNKSGEINKSQQKVFSINVKGTDEKGKIWNLGAISFDLNHFVGKSREKLKVSTALPKKLVGCEECIMEFQLSVTLPEDIDPEDEINELADQ